MLLTISLTQAPATDLGYLLHKSPGRVHTKKLSFGESHVFYPEASDDRCTAALLVDIDPVGLVRGRRAAPSLEPYINDRPYAASSHVSVALSKVFATAMSGRSKERQELADVALPFEVGLPVLPSRAGGEFVERLFGPLGYEVTTTSGPLHPRFPEWGDAPYVAVHLRGSVRLRDLLSHLYVLIPTFDGRKHYWIDKPEIDKLLRRGGEWLAAHPDRELIAHRYLGRRGHLTREALERLVADEAEDPDEAQQENDAAEEEVEERISLHELRIGAVMATLKRSGAQRVLDLGCGEGKLLERLLKEPALREVVGLDVSAYSLERAARKIRLDRMNERQRERVRLLQGSLTYRDERLAGYDAAVLMEVIEHLDEGRLPALEQAVFGSAAPGTVVVTTPNVEYNVRFDSLPAGHVRHRDHRFEWSREAFAEWAERVATRYAYEVSYLPVGPEDPEVGPPTQMAVFTRTIAS